MLKNVHLAPGWLMQLEKKLHSLQPHACFRLFLTMEINPKVNRTLCMHIVKPVSEPVGQLGMVTCLQPQNL